MPGRHKNGFSLVEMLIALAVSAIIIAAAFGSYAMIARNFDFQKDMKYIAQSARAVVDMINSDIRLAGYTAVDNGAITDAVMLADSGTAACCDAISVIYDQTPTERRQVTYYTKQFTSDDTRFRLYKHICQITTPLTIAEIQAGQCPATATLLAENPIADYVEDLQFSGFKNGAVTSDGSVGYGNGNMRWITPSSITAVCEDSVVNVNGGDGALTASGDAAYAFDGNHLTTYACKRTNPQSDPSVTGYFSKSGWIRLSFSTPVRLTKIDARVVPEIDGGTGNGITMNGWRNNWQSFTEPYGKYRPGWAELGFMYGRGGQQCVNTCADSAVPNNSCSNRHWNGGQQCLLQSSTRYENISIWGTTSKDLRNETRGGIDKQAITQLDVFVNGSQVCRYVSGSCVDNGYDDPNGYFEIAEIKLYGEVYGEAQIPHEIETSILIRSPNEHGNVDRSVGSPLTLGNRTNTWSDKRLRDSFTTATVVRNLYYSSQ